MFKNKPQIIILMIITGLAVWVVDAAIDAKFFYHQSFGESLILDVPLFEIYFRSFFMLLVICSGILIGVISSRRRRAEDALGERERLLAGVFASLQDGLMVKDRDMTIILANPVAERWYAHALPLVGRKCYEALYGRREPCEECPTRRTLETGETAQGVLPKRGPGGEPVGWLGIYASPLMDPATGEPRGVIEFARDITARKQAEEELRASEERYRLLVSNLPAVVFKGYVDWTLDLVDDKIEELTGYRKEEFNSRRMTWRDVILAEDLEGAQKVFLEALKTTKSYVREYRIRHKNGNILWIQARGQIFCDSQGQVEYVGGVFFDITARKEAEEALRKSEEQYRLLVNQIPAVVFRGYADWSVDFLDDKVETLTGYRKKDFDSRRVKWCDLIPSEDLDYAQKVFIEALKTDRSYVREHRIVRKDGEIRWVQCRGQIFCDAAGNVAYISGVSFDVTARKEAEEALRREEARYRELVEHASSIILRLDTEGRITFFNEFAQTFFGYREEEILGRNVVGTIVPEKDSAGYDLAAKLRDVVRHPERYYSSENENMRRNGERVWVAWTNKAIHDRYGKLSEVLCIGIDRTEQRRAEEALRQSEARLAEAQRIARLGNWEWDIPRNELWWSDEIYRIFGLTPQEFGATYEAFLQAVHPDDRRQIQVAVDNALNYGEPYAIHHRIVLPNGLERVVYEQAEVSFNESGQPLRMAGTMQDITEYQQAQEALRRSEERYRLLAANVTDVIFTMDLTPKFTYVSPSVRTISGFDPEEIEGQPLERILTPASTELGRRILSEGMARIEAGEKDRELPLLEVEIVRKDGNTVWAEAKASFLQDSQGRPVGLVGVTRDITARRQLEEQLRQSQKMETVGRLAGGVAHDFNNLLTAILGYSELLLVTLDAADPVRRDVAEIKKAGERAALLTRQLLAFSRRQVLRPKSLNLNQVVGNLGNMLQRVMGEDIRLECRLAPELGRVMADPGQMEQVIMNLAVNARDAMPQGGQLIIETANVEVDDALARIHAPMAPGPYVLLLERDTGYGMDAATLAHIFEPFFTTKEVGKGTGLGLSTVYGIVKQSGGFIWAESAPGQGATFRIYLPRIDAAVEAVAPAPAAAAPPQGRETILLVEDEEVVRQIAARILQKDGYAVLTARDGQEALEICEQYPGPIHLLITDLVMPGMNGQELAQHFSHQYPGLKVLIMSGYAETGIIDEGVSHRFLQKPFEAQLLTRKVRELLDAAG